MIQIDENADQELKGEVVKSAKWTSEEDEQMTMLVRQYGTRNWGVIGAKLSEISLLRSGKQCRERRLDA